MGWWEDWMLEAELEAISISLLNRDNENQRGNTIQRRVRIQKPLSGGKTDRIVECLEWG